MILAHFPFGVICFLLLSRRNPLPRFVMSTLLLFMSQMALFTLINSLSPFEKLPVDKSY